MAIFALNDSVFVVNLIPTLFALFYSIDLKNNKLKYTGINKKGFNNASNWSYTYNSDSKNGWLLTDKGFYKAQYDPNKGFTFKQYPFYKIELGELSYSIYAEGKGENEVLWIGSQDDKLYRFLPELSIKVKDQLNPKDTEKVESLFSELNKD